MNILKLTSLILLYTSFYFPSWAQSDCLLIRSNHYQADGTLEDYITFKNDSEGRRVGQSYFNIDGTLRYYFEDELNTANKVLKRTWYDDAGNVTKLIEHEYQHDSLEVAHTAYLPDGSIDHARRFTYNDKGQLLKKEYDHKEQPYDYTTYEYREDGKMQSFSIYNPDGTLKTFYDYEYDEEGKMILYNAYDAEKNPTGYYSYPKYYVDLQKSYDVRIR